MKTPPKPTKEGFYAGEQIFYEMLMESDAVCTDGMFTIPNTGLVVYKDTNLEPHVLIAHGERYVKILEGVCKDEGIKTFRF